MRVIMFRKNVEHEQLDLFDYDFSALERVRKLVEKTEEYSFYELIFSQINEDLFTNLYSHTGRPNSPINSMLSALIIKEKKNWSYRELFKQLNFNLAVRAAIGLFNLDDLPFNEATLFNFQNRLQAHEEETGVNLFDTVFNDLTQSQIRKLHLKTNIARTDSFMINSNVKKYGRLKLLIEVVLRVYRILSADEKKEFNKLFLSYTEQDSEHYLYNLKGSDLSHEFEKIAEVYFWLKLNISPDHKEKAEYKVFFRVYSEHFQLNAKNSLELIPSASMTSDTLQSPDDCDATFRKKKGKEYHGFSANAVETCNPENEVNIVVDVSVDPNNKDDSKILNERLETISEKMPDLEELHFDGGYGSSENDKRLAKLDIIGVQTAVRGRKAETEMVVDQDESGTFHVTCPNGETVKATPTKTRYRALFYKHKCTDCPFASKCPGLDQKKGRVFYFDEDYFRRKHRHRQYQNIPPGHRKLRPNVEATMKEFVDKTKNHKLKVRGIFKASLFVYAAAIGINFGRISRYLLKKGNIYGTNSISTFIELILGMMKGFISSEWFFRDRYLSPLGKLCRVRAC